MVEIPRTAIILAGGLGTRLRSVVISQPKVLAPVAGRPFLDYLLTYLSNQGVQRVMLALGYLAEQVQSFVADGLRWNLEIDCAIEPSPLGTGGAIKYAFDRLKVTGWSLTSTADLSGSETSEAFFVLNGDTLFQIDLATLWRCHMRTDLGIHSTGLGVCPVRPLATIALRNLQDGSKDQKERGCVVLAGNGQITSFDEKPAVFADDPDAIGQNDAAAPSLWINGGVYIMSSQALNGLPGGEAISLERQLFPDLVQKGLLAGCPADGYFVDIGSPTSLAVCEQDVQKGVIF